MHLLLNKQKDGSGLFFLLFCKQKKERKESPGSLQAETGEGIVPCEALQSGANRQEMGLTTL